MPPLDGARKNNPSHEPRPFMLASSEPVFPIKPPSSSLATPTKKKHPYLTWTLLLIFGALVLLLLAVGFVLYKGLSLGERMQFENSSPYSFITELKHLTSSFLDETSTKLRGESDGRINVLLLGRAGEHYPGKNLTDTVMVMSIDTTSKQVALLSLPRDLYVPIAHTDSFTKLNSIYQYGLSRNEGAQPLKQSVEHIMGVPIHYFVTIDFDGFETIVNTIGGISIDVPRDFTDTRYPGKNYSYETFEIKKGWQTLDGATALKYVRERHADPEGDFGRAKRQQQVIEAIKNKTFSLGTLFNIVTIDRLLDTLGDSIKTDLSLEEMTRFLELVHTLDTQNVTTVVVDAWKRESLLRVSHIQVGDVSAFILVPRVGNWSEIIDVSSTVFHKDALEKRKQAIKAEQATLTLFSRSADMAAAEKIATLLQDELGFSLVTVLPLPPLNTPLEESIIVEPVGQNALEKPFSLDELHKRFSLTTLQTLPFTPRRSIENDYVIVIGHDLATAFSLDEAPSDLTGEDASFSEPLPPQPKKK